MVLKQKVRAINLEIREEGEKCDRWIEYLYIFSAAGGVTNMEKVEQSTDACGCAQVGGLFLGRRSCSLGTSVPYYLLYK